MNVCVCVYVRASMRTCVRACVRASVCVCVCLCVCVHAIAVTWSGSAYAGNSIQCDILYSSIIKGPPPGELTEPSYRIS